MSTPNQSVATQNAGPSAPQAELPRFKVLTGVEVSEGTITVKSVLPDRGAGYDLNQIRRWFKEDFHRWLVENGSAVKGKTVRFSGPNTVPGSLYAGIAVAKLGAERVQVSSQTSGEWIPVASHDDPEAALPVVYEPGHIVRARVFGEEVSGLVVIANGIGGTFQLTGQENAERVWVSRKDILGYEGIISSSRESFFAEQPRYRHRGDCPVHSGQTARFRLFGRTVSGRVTALRAASFNALYERGSTNQTAALVPFGNVLPEDET